MECDSYQAAIRAVETVSAEVAAARQKVEDLQGSASEGDSDETLNLVVAERMVVGLAKKQTRLEGECANAAASLQRFYQTSLPILRAALTPHAEAMISKIAKEIAPYFPEPTKAREIAESALPVFKLKHLLGGNWAVGEPLLIAGHLRPRLEDIQSGKLTFCFATN
jgi:hypothetical protein